MAKLEELVLKLTAENQELIAKVNETQKKTNEAFLKMQKAVDQFSKQSEQSTSRFSKIMDVFAGVTLANVASAITSKVYSAFSSLTSAISKGIEESKELEQQNVRLANSLALSGKYSQDAMKSLQNYASELESLIGVDDAVITKNLALLSSLTNLDTNGLKKAQTAAADLSVALGVDLSTATNLVAKAVNGNIAPLARYGINIKSTGDKTRDAALALQMLEQKFSGAAAGSMKTFAGVISRVQNSVSNFFQSLGDSIAKNPVIIAGINSLVNAFNEFSKWANENPLAIKKALADMFLFIIDSVARVIDVMDAIGRTYTFTTTLFKSGSLSKAVESALDQTALETISNKFKTAAVSAREAYATMAQSGEAVLPTIEAQMKATNALSEVEQERVNKNLEFANSLIKNAESVANAYSMQNEVFKMQYDADIINFETYKQSKLAAEAAFMEEQRLMLEQAGLQRNEYEIASTQLSREQALQRFKTQQELAKQEEALRQKNLQSFSKFFGDLSALQKTNSKELFAIGKAAALAQATIDGYAAVQGAYKIGTGIGGPPLGAAFAAAAVAATAVNISKIAATGLRRGIDSVPGVGTKDNFPAMLAPGERVVPSKTNEDLTAFLERMESKDSQQQIVFNLNFNGPVWSDKATAGSEIIEAINEAFDRGMGLRLRQA